MKWILAVALMAACTTASGTPRPPANLALADFAPTMFAPGDSLPYKLRWGKGARATGYRVTVASTPAGWSGLPTGTAVTDTSLAFTALGPAVWDSVTFTASVVSTQSGKTSAASTVTWKVMKGPGAPGPIQVDSSLVVIALDVKPDRPTIVARQQQQFCAFLTFHGGAVAERTQDRPGCDALYAALPTRVAVVSPRQQAVADLFCLEWKQSGGTITASGCDLVQIAL